MSDSPPDHPANQPADKHPGNDDQFLARTESRLDTDGLNCSKGRVADITGSGMRMIVAPSDLPKVGDIQSYTFADSKDEITITGLIKWVRKATLFTRRCEVGVEFIKLDPETRDAIIHLAIHGDMGINKDHDIEVAYTNLYQVLGSSRYASQKELRESYHKQAKAWHPDGNDHPKAAHYFGEIQRAYEILSDEDARADFDLRFFGPDPEPIEQDPLSQIGQLDEDPADQDQQDQQDQSDNQAA
jgi:DnaJ-like protein/PilZ domain-containing protein